MEGVDVSHWNNIGYECEWKGSEAEDLLSFQGRHSEPSYIEGAGTKGETVESERGQSKVASSRKWLQRESQRRAQGGNVVKKGFAMRKGSFSNIESFEYRKDRKSDRAR
jgi:hypothetical protein